MLDIVQLTQPNVLYRRDTILSNPCPVPEERGLYTWFFKNVPPKVPVEGCIIKDGNTLLYAGISPRDDNSKQNLRERIKKKHCRGTASDSTLRLTLGVLLTKQSGFPLRRVGSGEKMTFTHLGEQWLDKWMDENAFVCWVEHPAPWEVEGKIIENISPPLNIEDNAQHPFCSELSMLRTNAKQQAGQQSIANQDNQQRRK